MLFGKEIFFFDRIDSTNTYLKKIALESSEGLLVVANEQTESYGRNKKKFLSPVGGLYMSVLLKPKKIKKSTIIVALTCVATAIGIEMACNVNVKIKWINDIYISKKKIAGILVESIYKDEEESAVIVGIGINTNSYHSQFPREFLLDVSTLLEKATSVYNEELAILILKNLSRLYEQYKQGDYKEIFREYNKRLFYSF